MDTSKIFFSIPNPLATQLDLNFNYQIHQQPIKLLVAGEFGLVRG